MSFGDRLLLLLQTGVGNASTNVSMDMFRNKCDRYVPRVLIRRSLLGLTE
ncbi:MAG: hypothetical protein QNJ65_06560 [Xenococcaceae cyanobacterium MO_234.B1]|nr:hypothetical protein [Xenococcaceae cyanobacterium MO_234.B1]